MLLKVRFVVAGYVPQVCPLVGWVVGMEGDEGGDDLVDELPGEGWLRCHCWYSWIGDVIAGRIYGRCSSSWLVAAEAR